MSVLTVVSLFAEVDCLTAALMLTRPLAELAANTLEHMLARGLARVHCGSDASPETFRCEYPVLLNLPKMEITHLTLK